jgi:hypothetical protein
MPNLSLLAMSKLKFASPTDHRTSGITEPLCYVKADNLKASRELEKLARVR